MGAAVLLSKLVSEHAQQSCSETILETTLQKHCIPKHLNYRGLVRILVHILDLDPLGKEKICEIEVLVKEGISCFNHRLIPVCSNFCLFISLSDWRVHLKKVGNMGSPPSGHIRTSLAKMKLTREYQNRNFSIEDKDWWRIYRKWNRLELIF